jgi:SnoaL-like domain
MTTDNNQTPAATDRLERIVEGYFAMWNEADPAVRARTIQTTWAADARYLDPMFAATGADELDKLVVGVHQAYPGHRFRLVGSIDSHHDRARWAWELSPVSPAGAPPVAVGVDFAVLADDGRLREVTGFFEPPRQAA